MWTTPTPDLVEIELDAPAAALRTSGPGEVVIGNGGRVEVGNRHRGARRVVFDLVGVVRLEGRTVLVISHRSTVAEHVDRVVELSLAPSD